MAAIEIQALSKRFGGIRRITASFDRSNFDSLSLQKRSDPAGNNRLVLHQQDAPHRRRPMLFQ